MQAALVNKFKNKKLSDAAAIMKTVLEKAVPKAKVTLGHCFRNETLDGKEFTQRKWTTKTRVFITKTSYYDDELKFRVYDRSKEEHTLVSLRLKGCDLKALALDLKKKFNFNLDLPNN